MKIRRLLRNFKQRMSPGVDSFLRHVSGVIHVGANVGQERDLYESFRLPVIWIEPIPEVFKQLQNNLREYPRQRSYQYLLTDKDNEMQKLNISSNNGESSSILNLADHQKMWPHVQYTDCIQISSLSLTSLVKREQLDLRRYNCLILDTQGSELLVLRGGADLLAQFKYIKTEAADFESYSGCCRLEEIEEFLAPIGFKEMSRHKFAWQEGVGSYFDVVYQFNG